MFVDFFIHRPVFATVCALLIILAGAICIPNLPVAMYPTLAPPVVQVSCHLCGRRRGDGGKSRHHSAGRGHQRRRGHALHQLLKHEQRQSARSPSPSRPATTSTLRRWTCRTAWPAQKAACRAKSCRPASPSLKSNYNFVFGAGFYTLDGRYSSEFISNYLDVYVKDALKRVPGVGDVMIFGERKYAMRVWLDPVRLAARSLTATDVVSALHGAERRDSCRRSLASRQPIRSRQFQIPVRVVGRLTSPEEFDNLIVKNSAERPGAAERRGPRGGGRRKLQHCTRIPGHQAMGIGVEQLSNANALDVDRSAKAALEQLSKNFPPGLKYAIAFDSTTAVGQSIREVLVTLAEAIIIVIAVIFLFLLDWRATIIPAVTIPVSLIGTFAFIRIFSFSINSLTLFGITLATGLVVDDAIVVIENVQRHIHMEHSDPHEATSRAMGEVTSAVIATSLVLIAVFVPVSFFPGTTGILYRQFSLTIAFSIAISAFNALTLSPALSAMFLRGEEARPRQFDFLHIRVVSRAFAAFIHGADAFVTWLASTYARVIHVALQLRYVLLLVFFAGLGATVWIYRRVPTGFIPQEDQGYFMVIVQAPPGSSLAYTTSLAERGAAIIGQNPNVGGLFSIIGFSFAGSASNAGMMFVNTSTATREVEKAYSTAAVLKDIAPKLQMLMFMPNGGLVPLSSRQPCRAWAVLADSNSCCRTRAATPSLTLTAWRTRWWPPAERTRS